MLLMVSPESLLALAKIRHQFIQLWVYRLGTNCSCHGILVLLQDCQSFANESIVWHPGGSVCSVLLQFIV